MSIALGRVEEEIADTGATDVQMLWRDVGEDDARCYAGASL